MSLYVPKDYLAELKIKSGELNRDKDTNTKLIGYNFSEEGGKDKVPVLVTMLLRTANSNKIFVYNSKEEPFTKSVWLRRIPPYELEKGVFLVIVNLGQMVNGLAPYKQRPEVIRNTLPVDHGFIYEEDESKLYLINHVIVGDEYAEELTAELEGNWVDISEANRIAKLSNFSTMVLSTVKSI